MVKGGRVAERFNVPDSKSGVGATLPWVQIPPRPEFRFRLNSLYKAFDNSFILMILKLKYSK